MQSTLHQNKTQNLLPLYILFFATPWGVTGEAVGWVGAIILMLGMILKNPETPSRFRDLIRTKWIPIVSSFLFILWIPCSTLLNFQNSSPKALTYGIGYLSWALVPLVGTLAYGSLNLKELAKFKGILAVTLGLWGTIATLQYWTSSWVVHGTSVLLDEREPRIRGLFGNALTLSYTALVILPFCFFWIFRNPRDPKAWIANWGCLSILLYPESRTTLAVAIGILMWSAFAFVREVGTRRAYLKGAVVVSLMLCSFGAMQTGIGKRFKNLLSPESTEHYREYPTNRIVFWIVHKAMILERPLTGHGIDLQESYRATYYDRLGFKDISEKFGAHNALIQLITNFGLIGLSFFLSWLTWTIWFIRKRLKAHPLRHVYWQCFAGFLISGLTQNNFQDSPVRYALNLVCLSLWLIQLDS